LTTGFSERTPKKHARAEGVDNGLVAGRFLQLSKATMAAKPNPLEGKALVKETCRRITLMKLRL
jgi:hypothetical protein